MCGVLAVNTEENINKIPEDVNLRAQATSHFIGANICTRIAHIR